MNWFKRIKERLIGETIEPDETSFLNNNKASERNKEVRTSTSNETRFRFPIITDAEIYGWDEEIEQSTNTTNASSQLREEDFDEYETVPLYENARWPGNRKRKHLNEPTEITFKERQEQSNYKENRRVQTLREVAQDPVAHHVNKRFTPTSVPSPIFGFAPAEKEGIIHTGRSFKEEQREDKMTIEQLNQLVEREIMKEAPPIRLDEASTENAVVVEQSDYEDGTRELLQQKEKISEEPITVALEYDNSEENETDYVAEEFTEHPTERDEIDNNTLRVEGHETTSFNQPIEKTVPVAVETEQSEKELEEPIGAREQQVVVEQVSPIEQAAPQERTVPFNVLMLKSDKEKMRQKEILQREQEAFERKSSNLASKVPQQHQEIVEQSVEEEQHRIDKGVPSVFDSNEEERLESYVYPPTSYLIDPEEKVEDTEWLQEQSEKLEESLSHFGIEATVLEALQGPTVTRFELTVGQGTKVSRIRNLTDDLKLALAAKEIRMQAPIPGTSSIGIEIPNRTTRPVRISEVIESSAFTSSISPLEAVLGLDLTGDPVTLDLRKMPHGLIAGATGSGKSVCINSILISLLYKSAPDELKLMLIDPKMVELAPFNGIPHLISPVITDVKAANAALKWVVNEMERRYELLAHSGVRDIERYNKLAEANNEKSLKMPYLLVVIDELADLMMTAPADVETSIGRIAQKARAAGIHLIIATQRPSVDVITGVIKANVPTRIAFTVSSQVDSRTIIDSSGAERLLGKGDMLYLGNGQSAPVRLQGTFVTDEEIERIIDHVQREAAPHYLFGQDDLLKSATEEEADPLFDEVCQYIVEQSSASTSALQRQFSIGYNRAAKLMDRLEERGYISEQRGSRARDVLITEDDMVKASQTKLVSMEE